MLSFEISQMDLNDFISKQDLIATTIPSIITHDRFKYSSDSDNFNALLVTGATVTVKLRSQDGYETEGFNVVVQ